VSVSFWEGGGGKGKEPWSRSMSTFGSEEKKVLKKGEKKPRLEVVVSKGLAARGGRKGVKEKETFGWSARSPCGKKKKESQGGK